MADLRVGLIGIGGMGGCHYGNYKDVKGAFYHMKYFNIHFSSSLL